MDTIETFDAVRACAVAILDDVVLHAGGVTAGRGKVIDWRTVKSGEELQDGGDAFDTAQLFVALVGPEVALALFESEAPAPVRLPGVYREVFMANGFVAHIRIR